MPRYRASVGAIVFAGLTGCAGPAQSRGPRCGRPETSTAGWTARGGSEFTFRLPTAFEPIPAYSIDSEVGTWRAGTSEIGYDYGMYSARLADGEPKYERQVCDVEIGGWPARLVTGRHTNGQLVAAAHWPAVGPPSSRRGGARLTLYGTAADSVGQRVLVVSLWTIQFR